jgi:hypothetical protein
MSDDLVKLFTAEGAVVGGRVMHPNDVIAAALKTRQDGDEIAKRIVPPQDPDTVAYITVRLHATGALSVQGHIADKRMAVQLLDHARDALTRHVLDGGRAAIPASDVEVTPTIPLKEFGDMPPNQRGDG